MTSNKDTTDNDRYIDEYNRINELLVDVGVADKKVKIIEPIIANTAWMKVKLDDARGAVKNSQIVITYDNGGGQKGIRENPLFKGYEALWKSYMQGMDKILSCIPAEHEDVKKLEMEAPKNMLEIIRARKQA